MIIFNKTVTQGRFNVPNIKPYTTLDKIPEMIEKPELDS